MSRTISEIYADLGVPAELQLHMLRVAAVGESIASSWSGPTLDTAALTRVLLLHDVGNIVNMEATSYDVSTLQKRYRSRYGTNDHQVSRAIGAELGLGTDELDLMDAKVFLRNDETARSGDWTRKVAAYADQRVAPDGVQSLEDRLAEAKRRYQDKPGTSMNNPRTDELIAYAFEIERQLATYSTRPLNQLTNQLVAPVVAHLRGHRI